MVKSAKFLAVLFLALIFFAVVIADFAHAEDTQADWKAKYEELLDDYDSLLDDYEELINDARTHNDKMRLVNEDLDLAEEQIENDQSEVEMLRDRIDVLTYYVDPKYFTVFLMGGYEGENVTGEIAFAVDVPKLPISGICAAEYTINEDFNIKLGVGIQF